jgi:hypothetical protein
MLFITSLLFQSIALTNKVFIRVLQITFHTGILLFICNI